MKTVEKIFDAVFSFTTFMIVLFGSVALLIVALADREQKARDLRAKQVAYCYSYGQILVDTDAGARCVVPAALTVPK